MIKILKVMLSVTLFISCSQVFAKDNSSTIRVKCFVELYGGEKTIVYQILKEQSFNKIAKSYLNKDVMTTLSDEKQKVYKVLECTDYNQTFSNSFANSTEKVTAQ